MICTVDGCDRTTHTSAHCQLHRITYSPGVSTERLELFRMVAGDGDVDDRCRRILKVFRRHWWERT